VFQAEISLSTAHHLAVHARLQLRNIHHARRHRRLVPFHEGETRLEFKNVLNVQRIQHRHDHRRDTVHRDYISEMVETQRRHCVDDILFFEHNTFGDVSLCDPLVAHVLQ
jgi:ABC-type siderophore export system fused ATPase/permease subunit